MNYDKKIIIIDDETGILDVYSGFFSKRGFLVDTATNGIDGLDLIKKNNYQVAIIDISMPKMDGITVAKNIKDSNINTEIIIITGHGEKNDAINALNVGVAAWFEKHNISLEGLQEKVNELINNFSIENIGKILSLIERDSFNDK